MPSTSKLSHPLLNSAVFLSQAEEESARYRGFTNSRYLSHVLDNINIFTLIPFILY